MLKSVCFATLMLLCLTGQSEALTDKARRDYLNVCLGTGGINIDAIDEKSGAGNRESLSSSIRSVIETLPEPERMSAFKVMQECNLNVMKLESTPVESARINPRGNAYAEIYLDSSPIEYTIGIICKRPDIIEQLKYSNKLLKDQDPITREASKIIIDGIMSKLSAEFPINPLEIDFEHVDCAKERICEVRGTVPAMILDQKITMYGIPAYLMEVQRGSCKGKTGFVNERFIDF